MMTMRMNQKNPVKSLKNNCIGKYKGILKCMTCKNLKECISLTSKNFEGNHK